ncbi:MAG: lactate racemase domain-containing protein [Candidatus Korobacteraceae bacterium]
MSSNVFDRRKFLKITAGAAGCVPLIGTATALLPSQPTHASSIKGSAKSVVIPTHEWMGDLNERLDFPGDWEIEVQEMKGANAPVLSAQQIGNRLDQPIGTLPLQGIVAGKRRIVITFDDLTRPTPTYSVMPWLMGELRAAGVRDENVLLMGAFGSHRAMTQSEVEQKLGQDPARRYAWQNHNVFENMKDVGTTSLKNRIKLNQTFMASDCKICISGVKGHEQAGLSGGAKAVMPGVASLDTIQYNHWTILPRSKTSGTFKVFHNEVRQDMIEAARMAKVDFSVQIVMNQHRMPVGVYAGDIVWAHQAAARMAVEHYITPTVKDADIVVSNCYPVNNQSFRGQWWFDRSLRDGGTGVLIIQHPLGNDPVHWLNSRMTGKGGKSYFDLTDHTAKARFPRGTAMIVYSQYLTRNMINGYPPATRFAARWDDVIQMLQERHKGQPKVAVYPYGGMQEQELSLDV